MSHLPAQRKSPGSSAATGHLTATPTAEHSGSVFDLLRKKCNEEESAAWWDVASAEGLAAGLLPAPSRSLQQPPATSLTKPPRLKLPLHGLPPPPAPAWQQPRTSVTGSWPTGAANSPPENSAPLLGQARPASLAFPPGSGSGEPPEAKRAKLGQGNALPSSLGPQASSLAPRPLSSKLRPRAAAFFSTEEARARKRDRDSQRVAQFLSRKAATAELVNAATTLSSQPRTGDYRGVAHFGNPKQPTRTIPAGPWPLSLPAAVVEPEEHRLFVWRSHGYRGAVDMDVKIREAVQKLESTAKPEVLPGHSRGNFTMRQFMVHRSYTKTPRNGSYLLKNIAAAKVLAEDLAELIQLINNIFKARFPRLYTRYQECMLYVVQHASLGDTPIYNFWGVFASLSVNAGGRVWTLNHTDSDNYFAGLCVVVGFGPYDFHHSAKLVIDLGQESVEFELPPAIPLFLPSAIFAHYNTRIVGGDERRGSIVLWSSGKLFQWVDLGGRCESDLSAAEFTEWVNSRQDRLRAAFGCFPIFPSGTS